MITSLVKTDEVLIRLFTLIYKYLIKKSEVVEAWILTVK